MNPGDLVQIEWLDASYYMHADNIDELDFKRGGVLLKTTGYVVNSNKNSLILVGELDENDEPHRDFNLIPLNMIHRINLIKRRPK